jgi:hypothetical protein
VNHVGAVTTTVREAGAALTYASVWSLFAAAGLLAWRRRILAFVLRPSQPSETTP